MMDALRITFFTAATFPSPSPACTLNHRSGDEMLRRAARRAAGQGAIRQPRRRIAPAKIVQLRACAADCFHARLAHMSLLVWILLIGSIATCVGGTFLFYRLDQGPSD
jgi:hypothetical protein